MEKFYNMKKEEVLEKTNSRHTGLTSSEAKDKLEKQGYNELVEGKRKSKIVIFLEQFKDFLIIILIIAAVISAFLGDIESALIILFVVILNALLGTFQHIKAQQSLDALKQMAAPSAKVLRDGEIQVIPTREIVIGDIVKLDAGDYICADGYIIENAGMKINESALTGESESIEKDMSPIAGEVPIGDRLNMVFSGTFLTYGRGSFIVTGTGMNTEVGKIASLLKSTSEKKTPLQVNLDNFGKKLSIAIIILCVILFALSVFLRGEGPMEAFMFAVALAVAAIPEALSSIVTIVLALGTSKMAKENAIMRKLHAVEGLGSVSIICSDKTGTLTQNKMTIKEYYINDENDINRLIVSSVLCNDSSNKDGVQVGDPTEIAMVDYAALMEMNAENIRTEYPRLGEIPFDSDRKLMSTVHEINGKLTMITKGAVDVITGRCANALSEEELQKIEDINMEFANKGLRVLAFASKQVDSKDVDFDEEYGMEFMGLMAMMDPPREESKDAVAKCISAGIRPIMITGDHKITASAIARQIGILDDRYIAVEGAEIDSMSDEELKGFVENVSVYARVSPEHKIRIVRAWQEKGNIVSMTGDGVNDAPALKQADIGVAMGITGSEVSKDAASMILTDDNFATIVKAVENGRNIYANIKKSIKFLLSGNTAAILAVLYASILGLAVPFAPIHLLFINLLTDSLPAIALGLDPHDPNVMKEKPRNINESILTGKFMLGILVEGILIEICTMTAYYFGMYCVGGSAGMARTMAFATLCLTRLIHGFDGKSDRAIIFSKQMWNNKFLWGAFFIGVLCLAIVLLVPGLAGLFSVTALGAIQLLIIGGLAVAYLIVIQIIKFFTSVI